MSKTSTKVISASGSPPSSPSSSISVIDDHAYDDVLGPVPLLPGEDRRAFNALRTRIFAAAVPTDMIEALHCREVSIMTWDIKRIHEAKNRTVEVKIFDFIKSKVLSARDRDDLYAGLSKWRAGDPAMVKKIDALLARQDTSIEAIRNEAYASSRSTLEKFDDNLQKIELRRREALRDIDRRREAFIRRLQLASTAIDAEYRHEYEPSRNVASPHAHDAIGTDPRDVTPKSNASLTSKRKSELRAVNSEVAEPRLPGLGEPS